MNLSNLPQVRSPREYTAAVADFTTLVRRHPDIVAVYLAGTVQHPGISDLDFLLCLNDHPTSGITIDTELDTELAQLIGHGSLLKIDQANFAQVPIIDDFPLRHVYGQKFRFRRFRSVPFTICRVLDWLPERVLSLHRLRSDVTVDVTYGLQLLKSLALSLELVRDLTGAAPAHSLPERIGQLRATWFTNRRRAPDFMQLVADAIPAGVVALIGIDEWLQDHQHIQPMRAARPGSLTLNIKGGPRFVVGNSVGVGRHHVTLPLSYFYFWAAQAASGKGFIRRQLRQSFHPRWRRPILGSISAELLRTIELRMDYCDDVAGFLRTYGISRGLLKYGWFLK